MIEGAISDEFDPIVELNLRAASGRFVAVRAVVDTGFTGWLTLPRERIRSLGLIQLGQSRMGLADGTFVIAGRFEAVIMWDGRDRLIPVEEADAEPLVGMRLLDGSDLVMSVCRGGAIHITPRPRA